jgi:hypothetical protein
MRADPEPEITVVHLGGESAIALRANDDETSKSLKFRLGGEGRSSWSCETKLRR